MQLVQEIFTIILQGRCWQVLFYFILFTITCISFVLSQTGMIRTLNDTFYINPLPSRVIRRTKFSGGQLHVIYRRSVEELSSACKVSSTNSLVLLTVVSVSFANVPAV